MNHDCVTNISRSIDFGLNAGSSANPLSGPLVSYIVSADK